MQPKIHIHDFHDTGLPKPSIVSILQIKQRPYIEDSYSTIKSMIGKALWEEQANWIILPQNLGSEILDTTVEKLLKGIDRDIVFVSSSYKKDGLNQACIFIKKGHSIFKFSQQDFSEASSNEYHIFVNTGLGDFCVYLGSEIPDSDIFQSMANFIDLLIISVCNKTSKPFSEKLIDYCQSAYIATVYANQAAIPNKHHNEIVSTGGKSSFFMPCKDIQKRRMQYLDRTDEKILTFTLDISLLEKGREQQEVTYLDTPLALANELCQPRYKNCTRDKEWWNALWENQQSHLVHNLFLEQWEATLLRDGLCNLIQKEKTYPISFLPFYIGRTHRNDICLTHETISKMHALLFQRDDSCYIKDLNSRCGIFALSPKTKILMEQNQEVELHSEEHFWLAKVHDFSIKYNDQKVVLLMWENNKVVNSVIIEHFPFLLGRTNPVLKLSDPLYKAISEKHAAILYKDGKYYLHDLGSKHGTYRTSKANLYKIRKKIEEPMQLHDQNVFAISKHTFFKFIQKDVKYMPDMFLYSSIEKTNC